MTRWQFVTGFSSFVPGDMQVIPLDITVELQKQIMSELEILYKVSGQQSHFPLAVPSSIIHHFSTRKIRELNILDQSVDHDSVLWILNR